MYGGWSHRRHWTIGLSPGGRSRRRERRAGGAPVRLIVEGAPGQRQGRCSAAVADGLGLQAFVVDAVPAETPWRQFLDDDAAPRARAWPGRCRSGAGRRRPRHRTRRCRRLQAVCVEPGESLPEEPRAADMHVILPVPDSGARLKPGDALLSGSAAWPAMDHQRLAERPGLTIGDLVSLRRNRVASVAEAERQLRLASAQRLGDLVERLETSFDWDDLVLPAALHESLRDFAFEARARVAFWEREEIRRLFPGGRGLVALFAGPPGTGKTMAAQVIAREIGVDVLRIDLATLMSKYIGETAKNLKRVFYRAAEMHALLLFDEADALFASRTEVKDSHDRYANTDTNYLLQQLEGFAGIAILASNRKTNIDTAFLRRIRYVYDFPRPEAADRRRLWRKLAAPILGERVACTLAPAFDALGDGLELSGAQIKNALVAGHFAARRRGTEATIVSLLSGIDRELVKEGRALSPRERQRLVQHG